MSVPMGISRRLVWSAIAVSSAVMAWSCSSNNATEDGGGSAPTETGATGGASSGASGSGGSTAGASGASGQHAGGATSGCATDADCAKSAPSMDPPGCATAKCDAVTKKCKYAGPDADMDGHASAKCKVGGMPSGDDCDDGDAKTFPGPMAWDGPMGDGHPNACDGKDNDCDGKVDDGVLTDGSTCECTVGKTQGCTVDSNGNTVNGPSGKKAVGICHDGTQTCAVTDGRGQWGACSNFQGPKKETCNGMDDDCNGVVDDAASDASDWAYDGDGDFCGAKGYATVKSCAAPAVPPKECPTCDPKGWKAVTDLTGCVSLDCDDADPQVRPNAPDICDGKDNDCDGTPDEGCGACKVGAACGSADTCNVGVYTACNPGTPGTCSGGPAQPKVTYCPDVDGDGYCALAACSDYCPASPPDPSLKMKPKTSCLSPTKADCKDGDAAINPGAGDPCDGIDNDCDGTPDEGCGSCVVGGACGSASMCNVGTYTACTPGTPGTCSGGPPQTQVTYCPDVDGDGYCALSACKDYCPATPPDPSLSMKPKTSCTSPTLGDCNDGDASINPGAIEVCADNVDNNCDNQTDPPPCTCVPNSVDTQCTSATVSWPGGYPQGPCHYGSRTCSADGTAWSACTGDRLPAGSDSCAVAGDDSNCDGVPNEGCQCWPGSTLPTCTECGSYWCANGVIQQNCTPYTVWTHDNDYDGHGDPYYFENGHPGRFACTQPTDGGNNWVVGATDPNRQYFVGPSDDCADNDNRRHPGQGDVCGDGVDNDCAGGCDDGCWVDFYEVALGCSGTGCLDEMLTTDPTEGGGTVNYHGFLYASPIPGVTRNEPMYRCYNGVRHYATTDINGCNVENQYGYPFSPYPGYVVHPEYLQSMMDCYGNFSGGWGEMFQLRYVNVNQCSSPWTTWGSDFGYMIDATAAPGVSAQCWGQ